MKKIMVFIGGYLPGEKYGGPVTSIYNFTEIFGTLFDISIVCCDHDFGEKERYQNVHTGWNSVGKARVVYLPDRQCNRKYFLKLIMEEAPDLIYASGIMHFSFNAPMIYTAKKIGIPVLLAPRGDICKNAISIKKWKKIPFLFLMKCLKFFDGIYFHATMEEEEENLVKYLGVDIRKIYVLPNLPAPTNYGKFYSNKELGKLRVVFVSRIQTKKNLLDAIKAVNLMNQKCEFDIYGPIENVEYWEKCTSEIQKSPSNVSVRYCGVLSPSDAKEIYSKYNCFLFLTLSENYGHVIAEALSHDCPVIISQGTTPWDDLMEWNAGAVIPLGNLEAVAEELDRMAKMSEKQYREMIKNVREYIKVKVSLDQLKEKYEEMILSIMEGKK